MKKKKPPMIDADILTNVNKVQVDTSETSLTGRLRREIENICEGNPVDTEALARINPTASERLTNILRNCCPSKAPGSDKKVDEEEDDELAIELLDINSRAKQLYQKVTKLSRKKNAKKLSDQNALCLRKLAVVLKKIMDIAIGLFNKDKQISDVFKSGKPTPLFLESVTRLLDFVDIDVKSMTMSARGNHVSLFGLLFKGSEFATDGLAPIEVIFEQSVGTQVNMCSMKSLTSEGSSMDLGSYELSPNEFNQDTEAVNGRQSVPPLARTLNSSFDDWDSDDDTKTETGRKTYTLNRESPDWDSDFSDVVPSVNKDKTPKEQNFSDSPILTNVKTKEIIPETKQNAHQEDLDKRRQTASSKPTQSQPQKQAVASKISPSQKDLKEEKQVASSTKAQLPKKKTAESKTTKSQPRKQYTTSSITQQESEMQYTSTNTTDKPSQDEDNAVVLSKSISPMKIFEMTDALLKTGVENPVETSPEERLDTKTISALPSSEERLSVDIKSSPIKTPDYRFDTNSDESIMDKTPTEDIEVTCVSKEPKELTWAEMSIIECVKVSESEEEIERKRKVKALKEMEKALESKPIAPKKKVAMGVTSWEETKNVSSELTRPSSLGIIRDEMPPILQFMVPAPPKEEMSSRARRRRDKAISKVIDPSITKPGRKESTQKGSDHVVATSKQEDRRTSSRQKYGTATPMGTLEMTGPAAELSTAQRSIRENDFNIPQQRNDFTTKIGYPSVSPEYVLDKNGLKLDLDVTAQPQHRRLSERGMATNELVLGKQSTTPVTSVDVARQLSRGQKEVEPALQFGGVYSEAKRPKTRRGPSDQNTPVRSTVDHRQRQYPNGMRAMGPITPAPREIATMSSSRINQPRISSDFSYTSETTAASHHNVPNTKLYTAPIRTPYQDPRLFTPGRTFSSSSQFRVSTEADPRFTPSFVPGTSFRTTSSQPARSMFSNPDMSKRF